jgi:hypothetical protein
MMVGGEFRRSTVHEIPFADLGEFSIAYMINENSIQFNIVSKNLGSERMAFFLNQSALEIREILASEGEAKAKL